MKRQQKISRGLTVAQWHQLTQEGAWIPVRIQLHGSSMQPLIRRMRDYVTIEPLNRPLKIGDVVLFHDGAGRYVVHRVWKLEPNRVITLGDNCKNADRPLSYGQILGLVTKLERGCIRMNLDSVISRLFGRLWMELFPVRCLYYKMRSYAGGVYRKMKGR